MNWIKKQYKKYSMTGAFLLNHVWKFEHLSLEEILKLEVAFITYVACEYENITLNIN